MRLSSPPPRLERARPLLGTIVRVAVEGLEPDAAHAAIDAAFAEVARVHALMSYHAPDSDLSRLNRGAASGPVAVHRLTLEVLARAQALSEMTGGVFDVSIAPALEAAAVLPAVEGPSPDPKATWRDIRLDAAAGTVRFERPLRIDLGGIAKGYAVDRAQAALMATGASAGVVNAGGDLRAFGPPVEVALRTGDPAVDGLAVLILQDGAAASSGRLAPPDSEEPLMALHLAGGGGAVITGRFVCVTAPECVLADALTKAALALGEAAGPILARLGAEAHLIGPERTWLSLGAAR